MKDAAGDRVYALFTAILITPQHSTVMGSHRSITSWSLRSHLLTWFNFSPSMDE